MKMLVLLLALLVGCDGRTVQVTPPVSANEVAELRDQLAAVKTKCEMLETAIAKRARVKPIATPVTPQVPTKSNESLEAEAAAIVGRLNEFEQAQLGAILARIGNGTINTFERRLASELTGGRCDALLGESAIREMRLSTSPGMKWAAANLTPQQANRVLMSDVGAQAALNDLAGGSQLNSFQLEALERAIGSHPALSKIYAKNADATLVKTLASAIKQSEAAESVVP